MKNQTKSFNFEVKEIDDDLHELHVRVLGQDLIQKLGCKYSFDGVTPQ